MQRSNTILTRDGTRIWMNCYIPGKENGRLIVIAPDTAISHQFYHEFALFFKELQYNVITFDYRGVGESAPQQLKGYKATLHDWAVQDLDAVLLYVHHSFPGREIIYVGHGIGGEIVGLVPASQYINKLILISTALSCDKLLPLFYRLKIKGMKFFYRTSGKILGFIPAIMFKERMPKGVYYEMANWCDSANGMFDYYPDNNYRKLNIPVLVFTFTDDWLSHPNAVKELLKHFTNAVITWYHLDPKRIKIKKIGHNNFFHPRMKTALWENMQQWMNHDSWTSQGLFNFYK